MRFLSVAATTCLALLALAASAASASVHQTPGSLASVTVPDGFVAQYDQNSDVTLLGRGAQSQIMLIAGPAISPRAAMLELLKMFGAQHLAPQVQDASLAGCQGVKLDVTTQVYERWYVLSCQQATLVVRAASSSSFQELEKATAQVVQSVKIAPAEHPQRVAGSYDTGYYRSGMGDYGSSDGTTVFAESGTTLLPDGTLRDSSTSGASASSGTVTSESHGRGRWEVRGERLLIVHGDGAITNLRVKAFSNGLELWNGQGGKLLWARR